MQTQASEKLVRKQFLIAPRQVNKLKLLADKQKTSAAAIVRMAIDAFNPDMPADLNESELFDLVSTRVKEAIADTEATRKRLHKTLTALENK